METNIIIAIVGTITTVISGLIGWFSAKSKYKHEMEMQQEKHKGELETLESEHKHTLETMEKEQSNKLTDSIFKEAMKSPKGKMLFNQIIGTALDEQNIGNLRNKKQSK